MNEMVAAMCVLFSEINKKGLKCAGDVTVSKHITLYGPSFSIIIWQQAPLHKEGFS